MKTRKQKTQQLAFLGVLSALTVVISFLPIKTLGLEITLSMVPVAIAATLYGPVAGAMLGGVFGVTSFLQCLGYSPFGAMLLSISPWLTALVCIPTRILAGALAGVLSSAFSKNKTLSGVLGSVAAPVLNTVFFMGTMCLCFYNTDYIQGFVAALGAANPISFILLFVGINGLVEIIAGIAIAYPASIAVRKAVR